ncbi:hypothetical protein [Streptomyces coelicoflavus]|uniref:hypothetical protein n=1 Tax=Streptomyces coelicoflavus TaxID=285562 RepID=UPI002E27298D
MDARPGALPVAAEFPRRPAMPLFRVGDWARTRAIAEFGIDGSRLPRDIGICADLDVEQATVVDRVPEVGHNNGRARPTGRTVLHHLGELYVRIGNETDPPTVQIIRGVQQHLPELLGIVGRAQGGLPVLTVLSTPCTEARLHRTLS